jgi:uncharacterized protein YjiS (DUF1127 family)
MQRADAEAHTGGARQLLRGWWDAYWQRRAKRATVFMLQGLDDRVLSDIGIDRSEIESVVYGSGADRIRHYRPAHRGPTG